MALALVYRHLDAKNRFAGLSLGQAFSVGAVTFFALTALSPIGAAILSAAAYTVIRLALRGRQDGFMRHWTWWAVRRFVSNGHVYAHTRCRVPRFPYAPHTERDVASRKEANGTVSR